MWSILMKNRNLTKKNFEGLNDLICNPSYYQLNPTATENPSSLVGGKFS